MRTPTPGRVAAAAGFALCLGLTVVVLFQGFDPNYPLRLLEGIAVVAYNPSTGEIEVDLPPRDSGLRWDEFIDALAKAYESRFEE